MKPPQPLLLLIAAGAILALCLAPAIVHPDLSHSDFPAFWLAGQLSRTGGDPYDPAQWRIDPPAHLEDRSFLYPRPLSVLFVPLSWLDLEHAAALWWVLSWIALGAAVLVLLSLYQDTEAIAHYLLPVLAGAFLFRPFWAALANGQMSAFLLLDLAGAAWLWKHDRWLAGGMLLSLLALKPQLGGPLLITVLLWLVLRRRWSALAGIVAGGLALDALGFLADPGWIGKFLSIGSGKFSSTFGFSPTVWGLAAWLTGFRPSLGIPLGSLAALLVVALVAWSLSKTHDPALALSGMVVLALLITPYLWSYDQTLLLLPIAVCTLALLDRMPYLLGALLPLGMASLAVLFQMVAMRYQLDLVNAQLSLVMLALFLVSSIIEKSRLYNPC